MDAPDRPLILLDTNILLRYARTTDPAFATSAIGRRTFQAPAFLFCATLLNLRLRPPALANARPPS